MTTISRGLELFIAGLVLVATSEVPFDTFACIWNTDVARTWEHEAHAQHWAFQPHGWGDLNRPEDN